MYEMVTRGMRAISQTEFSMLNEPILDPKIQNLVIDASTIGIWKNLFK